LKHDGAVVETGDAIEVARISGMLNEVETLITRAPLDVDLPPLADGRHKFARQIELQLRPADASLPTYMLQVTVAIAVAYAASALRKLCALYHPTTSRHKKTLAGIGHHVTDG
jgi:hypothetical protein